MKVIFPFALLGLFFLSANSIYASNETGIEAVFSKAKSEQKNIFIKYATSWCEECTFLNDSILANPYVKSILQEEYVVVMASLNTPNSKGWFKRYQITCVPTIQILDVDGNVLLEDYIPREEDLYTHLLEHIIPKELSVASGLGEKSVDLETAEATVGQISIPEQYQSTDTYSGETTRLPDSPPSIIFVNTNNQPSLSQPKAKHEYTVTVGAYSVLQNAEKHKQSIIRKNASTEVFIEQDLYKKLFRVNAGRFLSRQSCQPLVRMLKAENVTCYIRRLPLEG